MAYVIGFCSHTFPDNYSMATDHTRDTIYHGESRNTWPMDVHSISFPPFTWKSIKVTGFETIPLSFFQDLANKDLVAGVPRNSREPAKVWRLWSCLIHLQKWSENQTTLGMFYCLKPISHSGKQEFSISGAQWGPVQCGLSMALQRGHLPSLLEPCEKRTSSSVLWSISKWFQEAEDE